jgi:hypothetical protein
VGITVDDPAGTAAQSCLCSYFAELDLRFENGFDPGASIPAPAGDLVLPNGLLLVARLDGEPVGCGALRFHGACAVRLETNRRVVEAIALYRSCGYVEVPAFHAEPYAPSLVREAAQRRLIHSYREQYCLPETALSSTMIAMASIGDSLWKPQRE